MPAGDSVNNWLPAPTTDIQPATGLFQVAWVRHLENASINAATTNANRDQWRSIVSAARSSMTTAEFVAVVASVWPGWAATHLTGANGAEYRQALLAFVDP